MEKRSAIAQLAFLSKERRRSQKGPSVSRSGGTARPLPSDNSHQSRPGVNIRIVEERIGKEAQGRLGKGRPSNDCFYYGGNLKPQEREPSPVRLLQLKFLAAHGLGKGARLRSASPILAAKPSTFWRALHTEPPPTTKTPVKHTLQEVPFIQNAQTEVPLHLESDISASVIAWPHSPVWSSFAGVSCIGL